MQDIKLTECPRDAIQGLKHPIPAGKKAAHINQLLRSGLFERIDFGSFVSAKAVPQMADTEAVVDMIEDGHDTQLLAIVLNERGADTALRWNKIAVCGYPFSISEEFQQRNGNSSIAESFERMQRIQDKVTASGKELEVYISMAFGNPYGEEWSEERLIHWLGTIAEIGVYNFSLADTTAEAHPDQIARVFEQCNRAFPALSIGAHFHADPSSSLSKIQAAYLAGCKKFDGALLGFGGCPFAQNTLVGNVPTEDLLHYFNRGSQEQIQALQQSFRELIASEEV